VGVSFDKTLTGPTGINGKWPCPPIEANVGDRVIVNINNKLGNESTSLHFHGLLQKGSNHMDGPSHATQCPVPPGYSFTYDFIVRGPLDEGNGEKKKIE
jgi:iron transport multicopper oxidase